MNIKKDLELAWNILVHSKLRSWLTIIGIVIGIASVVSILSISQSATNTLENQISSLGANIITITSGYSRAKGMSMEGGIPGGDRENFGFNNDEDEEDPKLTNKDLNLIKTVSNIDEVMGTVSGQTDVIFKTKTSKMSITGVNAEVWQVFNEGTELSEGRFLTVSDKYSAIVGSRVIQTFNDDIKIGSKISINGINYNVVGILESSGGMGGLDNSIIIPYSVAVNTLENKTNKEYDTIYAIMSDVDSANETLTNLENKLMLSRGILFEDDKDFTVSSSLTMQETLSETMNTMSLFLGAIAGISLLVGAVGIANSMFTSVLEKTRDIGVLKAIGAKNKDVLSIFLFNSGLIGLVGGIGGVLLGAIVSSFISLAVSGTSVSGMGGFGRMFSSSSLSIELILGALLISVIIGMISGLIPAQRAAKLKPVEALRSD